MDDVGLEGGAVPQDGARDAVLVDRQAQRMGEVGVLRLRHAVAIEDIRRGAPVEAIARAPDAAGGGGAAAGTQPVVPEGWPSVWLKHVHRRGRTISMRGTIRREAWEEKGWKN